jgi:segregation and condensation protein A
LPPLPEPAEQRQPVEEQGQAQESDQSAVRQGGRLLGQNQDSSALFTAEGRGKPEMSSLQPLTSSATPEIPALFPNKPALRHQQPEFLHNPAEPETKTPLPELATDGVGLLVAMARRGEIDPWNIDIVKVTDQYLQAVADLKAADLKITGKTLLYLAILLRMKSDQLAGMSFLRSDSEDFLEEMLEPDFMDDARRLRPRLSVRSLDDVIKRRTSTKQPRIRTVTLEDLLRELRRYEEIEARRSLQEKVEKSSQRRMTDYADFTADDIEEMAHEEFHEDNVTRLRAILVRLLIENERVSLDELMHEGGLDRISAYLALLFLAVQGDFDLEQESFYTELYITPTQALSGVELTIDTEQREASA